MSKKVKEGCKIETKQYRSIYKFFILLFTYLSEFYIHEILAPCMQRQMIKQRLSNDRVGKPPGLEGRAVRKCWKQVYLFLANSYNLHFGVRYRAQSRQEILMDMCRYVYTAFNDLREVTHQPETDTQHHFLPKSPKSKRLIYFPNFTLHFCGRQICPFLLSQTFLPQYFRLMQ